MSDRVPFSPDAEPDLAPKGVDVNRIDGLSFMDYSSYHRMCDFLRISDMDRRDHKIAEKVSYLTDWAQTVTKSPKELAHKQQIKRLIKDLGESHVGLDLLDRLHRFTRLDKERQEIEGEMNLYKELPEEEVKPKPKPKPKPRPKEVKKEEPEQPQTDYRDTVIDYFLGNYE